VIRALLAAVALGLGLACAPASDEAGARAASIERQLLSSCSCHPKKIEGLPLQTEIRSAISAGVAQGLDDNTILWRVLERHGRALLEAGVEDVALRAQVAIWTMAFCLLLGSAAFLLQLRRPG
jgi:hypothetical protein